MYSAERHSLILKELEKREHVTVRELMELLDASESTIRRDLTELSREGRLTRTHGGAVRLPAELGAAGEAGATLPGLEDNPEKERIAAYAASLIRPSDCVFIDAGTTTGYMLPYLYEKGATYVTNSIAHARAMAARGLKVLLVGGELKVSSGVIVGADAILHVQKYHFTRGFFGTNAVHRRLGYTTPDVREALIKRVAIEGTSMGERYILATHEKFGLTSAVTFSELKGTVIITDREPDSEYHDLVELRVVRDNQNVI